MSTMKMRRTAIKQEARKLSKDLVMMCMDMGTNHIAVENAIAISPLRSAAAGVVAERIAEGIVTKAVLSTGAGAGENEAMAVTAVIILTITGAMGVTVHITMVMAITTTVGIT